MQQFPCSALRTNPNEVNQTFVEADSSNSPFLKKQQSDDECKAFAKLMTQKMLKYPMYLQVSVQQDIMEILFKADRQNQLNDEYMFQHLSAEPAVIIKDE